MWRLIQEVGRRVCHPQQLVTTLLELSYALHTSVALALFVWLTMPDVLRLGLRVGAKWLVGHPISAMVILLLTIQLAIIVFLLRFPRVTCPELHRSSMKITSKRPRPAAAKRLPASKLKQQRRAQRKRATPKPETWTGQAVSIIPSDAAQAARPVHARGG
jgi:hypothetical protein